MWSRTRSARRPARDRAPSIDGRLIAAALAIFPLGRRGLATGLAVVILNAILVAVWDQ